MKQKTRLQKVRQGNLRRMRREQITLINQIARTGTFPVFDCIQNKFVFVSVDRSNARLIGSTSGRWHLSGGYVQCPRLTTRPSIKLHNLLLGVTGSQEVDHRDRDRLNNRRSNLRVATRSQNNVNKPKYKGDYRSPYKGVSRANSRSWRSRITVNGATKLIGCFPSEHQAAYAYNLAATHYYGEFATLNDVSPVKLTRTCHNGNAAENVTDFVNEYTQEAGTEATATA